MVPRPSARKTKLLISSSPTRNDGAPWRSGPQRSISTRHRRRPRGGFRTISFTSRFMPISKRSWRQPPPPAFLEYLNDHRRAERKRGEPADGRDRQTEKMIRQAAVRRPL